MGRRRALRILQGLAQPPPAMAPGLQAALLALQELLKLCLLLLPGHQHGFGLLTEHEIAA